ncbi:nucleotidyl transferase AbiEii/AbiGii toxin family protein [Candidatus Daviesbacteria bacterium]|nr:nucleotidyl transferase AbiEii/AbiGii toxin family protein [Candidatus Daviesbacteria bacterium]
MIVQEELTKLVNKYQTNEVNIWREYFQNLFLSYFYQQPQTNTVYFKGGTALRMLYKSPRFSEDLDFSAAYSGIQEIEEATESTLSEIEKENVKVGLSESKETSGGYLGTVIFDERITLQLQISLREGQKTGEVVTVTNDFVPPYTIVSLSQGQLVDEKMSALFYRKKPRDFYDLYFMLRANLIFPGKRNLLIKAKEILQTADINFENELKQYLPKTHWAIIRNFKQALEREIERFL